VRPRTTAFGIDPYASPEAKAADLEEIVARPAKSPKEPA